MSTQDKSSIIPGYEILNKLGQGGMGAVYKARQTSMDREVAIKILPKSMAKQGDFKERFFREAKAAGRLNHPNIVAAIDAQEAGGYCYIAMEFVDGTTISDKLKDEGCLSESEALSIALQIAKGLAHAWKADIVHRDVKPENFLYTHDSIAKLCDLGIAKAPTDAGLTQAGTALGTPRYIAPEQARGLDTIDFRADIYSLGASLYHMLAGAPPFDGPTAPAIMLKHVNEPLPPLKNVAPDVSRNTCSVVEKMMAKKPEKRYQSDQELIGDLEAVMAGETPAVASVSRKISGRKQAPRRTTTRTGARRPVKNTNPATYAIAGGGALLLIIVVFVMMPPSDPNPPHPDPPPRPVTSSTPEPVLPEDNEQKARAAFIKAQGLEVAGNQVEALRSFRNISASYPDTSIEPKAKREAERLSALIEKDTAERRIRQRAAAAAKELVLLLARRQTTDKQRMISLLTAFAAKWKGTSSADQASGVITQIRAEIAAAEAPPEQPVAKTIIENSRAALRGSNNQKIIKVLKALRQSKEIVPELTPDVARLTAAGSHSHIRRMALSVLAKYSRPAANKAALRQLTDRNEIVRLTAVNYVVSNRLREAIPVLSKMAVGRGTEAPDLSHRVRAAAKNALVHLK